ncbi:MAG: magnesium/cobalt transporter CorA [Gammaproteobacteria bacterium]|nr:magnesium/cobalt transporter CorA [Gammaproteobacteria bacterium]NNL45227.1 magnesium/cobalt transporter CorA [Woeseiaceae bacterium]
MALFNKQYHPAGTSPGTLTKARPADAAPLRIRLIDYDAKEVAILDETSVEKCEPYLQRDTVTWVHVEGRPTEAALRELGTSFSLHSLAMEDVLNIGQRPKVEPFADQLFIVVCLPMIVDDYVEVHQVSLFVGKNYVISFCEADFTPFEPIVKRLQAVGGRMRTRGADYLMYGLLDAVIDWGFPLLETIGLQLEELEEQVLESADRDSLAQIHVMRRELILLRRNLWPQREVINSLLRDDSEIIQKDTQLYLRDCYDHTIQIIDLLETYRDMAGSLLEIYLSSVSNRMNDVMRVLTVIATIFIPLTFIVGVYGMNFDRGAGPLSMPELGQPLGYVFLWIVMIAIAIGMVIFFRSRKWF